jgi:uncharacterized protein YhaN
MSLEETLLSIRREFSKNEKYRLFLQHLDQVEISLAQERNKNLDLLKEKEKLKNEILVLTKDKVKINEEEDILKRQIENLKKQIKALNTKIQALEHDDEGNAKYVKKDLFEKQVAQTRIYHDLYWKLKKEQDQLLNQKNNTHAT